MNVVQHKIFTITETIFIQVSSGQEVFHLKCFALSS